jgi:hypothetical protein
MTENFSLRGPKNTPSQQAPTIGISKKPLQAGLSNFTYLIF